MRPRMSSWQILLLVFALSLCLTPFDLPTILMPHLGARAAWWGEVPAIAAGLWGTAVAWGLCRRFHGHPLDQTVLAVLGPYLGYPYLAALALLFYASVPACLLVFGPAAHSDLLPRLPVAYVAVMVAATGTYAAHSGAEAIARSAEVLAPLLAVGLVIIYVPLFFHAQFGRLLPVQPPPWGAWWSAQVLGATGTIRGFLPLLVLGPLTAMPPSGGRLALASALAWLLIIAALVLPVAIFDARLAPQFGFPFLAAAATVAWRWLPLRSMVGMTLLVWYAVTFLVFSTYLWMTSALLARLAPRLPRKVAALILGATAAVVASLRGSGSDFAQAVAAAQAQTDVRVGFWATDLVLVGQGLAHQGLRQPLDQLLRDGDLSLLAQVAVVEGNAGPLLQASQPGGSALEIGERLKHSTGTDTGSIPVQFWRFMVRLTTPYSAAWAPVLAQTPKGYRAAGTAVFRGDALAAVLGERETPALGWLLQSGGFAPLTFPVGGGGRTVTLAVIGRRKRLLLTGPRAGAIRLTLYAVIRQGAGMSLKGARPRATLERMAAAAATQDVRAVLSRLQAAGADVVGFGALARQRDPTAVADWPAAFRSMHVALDVTVHIRRGGRLA